MSLANGLEQNQLYGEFINKETLTQGFSKDWHSSLYREFSLLGGTRAIQSNRKSTLAPNGAYAAL